MTASSKKPLIIIGNGEIASMAYEYFTHDSNYRPIGFAIGAEYAESDEFEGLPLIPVEQMETRFPPTDVFAFVAIGDVQLNRVRAQQYYLMKAKGYRMASYVSSRCFAWHNVEIGENCFILEGNTLQPFARIGDNVTLWSGNHIGHRSAVGDHVFMSSHVVVSGFCSIGSHSFIGVNASIANGVSVAEDNYIAMASVIASSTEADSIYQGNPAERRKISARRFCRVKSDA